MRERTDTKSSECDEGRQILHGLPVSILNAPGVCGNLLKIGGNIKAGDLHEWDGGTCSVKCHCPL